MDTTKEKRCPHYQIYSELLNLEGPPAYLAIRRCLLTERMIHLMQETPEGTLLANKLVVNVTNGKKYAFVGPDLDAVTQQSCTSRRCEERCTHAYLNHLNHLNIQDLDEEEVTCQEEEGGKEQKSPEVSMPLL